MWRYLLEIRNRILRYLIVFAIVFIPAAIFANHIYQWLTLPLLQHMAQPKQLIAIAVPAPFLIPFKSAACISVLITIPYLLYQVWQFIAPALYRHERKLAWLLLLSSSILFYVGLLFAFFVVLPLVFQFFLYVAPQGVEVKPDIAQYFSFIVKMCFSFGFAFELPIAIMLIIWSGICTREQLAKKRPYVIVGAFILGMLLTPPDVISQFLLAIPLWLLFEFGLLLSRLHVKNARALTSR